MPNQTALTTETATTTSSLPPARRKSAARATIHFGVDSDDGFSLTITGATFSALTNATNSSGSNSLPYNGGRGTS